MAIFFDLDGTLVDTVDDIITALNNLCSELNLPIPDPILIKDNTSFGLEKFLQIVLNTNINEIDPKYLASLKTRFKELYKQTKFANSKLFPGIQNLVDKLQQNKLKFGIVTNKTLEFARLVLDRVNLLTKVDCLVTADMVNKPKPFPDPLFLAIDKLKVDSKDCIFIGDAEQDIIAGNAAGVKTVAALFGYVGDLAVAKAWPANYFIHQPTEIWPLLKSLYIDS